MTYARQRPYLRVDRSLGLVAPPPALARRLGLEMAKLLLPALLGLLLAAPTASATPPGRASHSARLRDCPAPAHNSAPALIGPRHAPRPWQPGVAAAIAYAHTRAGEISFAVRSAHRLWGWRVAAHRPLSQRAEGDAAGRLPRRPARARPPADARRPCADRPDDPALGQHRGRPRARIRRPAGVYGVAARAGMRKFRLDPTIWGLSRIDAVDQARFFLHIDAHVVPPPPRHRHAPARHRHARASAGASAGCACPAGSCTSRAAGARARAPSSTRSRCCATATCACRVAVLITNSPSHEYAKRTLQGEFERLLRGVHQSDRPARASERGAVNRNPNIVANRTFVQPRDFSSRDASQHRSNLTKKRLEGAQGGMP